VLASGEVVVAVGMSMMGVLSVSYRLDMVVVVVVVLAHRGVSE
jgi:hypothetical protein